MTCPNEFKRFLECKKERDIKLFHSLQNWEINKVKELNPLMKNMYKQGLQNKLTRLKDSVTQMPTNFWY